MFTIDRLTEQDCAALAEFPGWIAYFYEVVRAPEQTLIYTTGLFYGHVELRDALMMIGRNDMVKRVSAHHRLPARERIDFWGRIALSINKPILAVDEKHEGDDGYSIIPLFKVYPDRRAELYLAGQVLHQRLAFA